VSIYSGQLGIAEGLLSPCGHRL